MRIIAFGHRQRVGKDQSVKFFLSYVRANYPNVKCERLALFDWAKDLCAQVYGYAGVRDRIYYENHPEQKDTIIPALGKSVRQVWLEMGYYLREIHRSTIPENALLTVQPDTQIIAISDIRSAQDVDYVRKFKGRIYRIDRPGIPKLETIHKVSDHPAYALDSSLEEFNDWDGVIDNSGTLKDLNKAICAIAEEMLRRL